MSVSDIIQIIVAFLVGGFGRELLILWFRRPKDEVERKILIDSHNENTEERKRRFLVEEKEELLKEIAGLRSEVKELRISVDGLRSDLDKKVGEISGLSTRWYALRTASLALTTLVRHMGVPKSAELAEILTEINNLVDEHSMWGERGEEHTTNAVTKD